MEDHLKRVESLRAGCGVRRRHQLPKGECAYCDRERESGNTFHPSHDASDQCRSGKRIHCSCDTCF